MKTKKIITALAVCAVLAATSIGFAACSDNSTDGTKTPLHMDVPSNVTIHDGGDDYSNDDDYVTFDAVDNAVSYQLFVWQDGDSQAKVVSGETTTIYMPSDLTSGSYYISVRAVGDQINYDFSNGSETATYTCKTTEQQAVTLAAVSNVALDFSNVNEDNAQYPTITFDAVDGAVRYSAYVYDATVDNDGNYEKSGDSITNFNIPANDTTTSNGTVSYMMDQTNYGDLHPGYFVVEVYTRGDDEYYLDSEDCGTGNGAWTGYTYKTPEVALSVNSDGDTATVTIDNVTDFYAGTEFTVNIYSDEETTTQVGTATFTYTGSSTSFGTTSYNYSGNTISVTDNAIAKDTTYYYTATANGDGTVYITSETGTGSVTATETQSSSGFPGGGDMNGGGGGDSSWDFSLSGTTYEISATESTSSFKINDSQTLYSTCYAILDTTPAEGCSYSYTFGHNDSSAPFTLDGSYMYLYTDGTVTFSFAATGPINAYTCTGTWTISGDTITIVFS